MIDVVLPLALAALSGSATGALLTYLIARKRLPIERDSAHAAASQEIVTAATELLAPMRDEIDRLDDEVKEARAQAERARTEAEAARGEAAAARREAAGLRRLASEADDYIRDLHARWDAHRKRQRPPFWRWIDDPTTTEEH